MSLDYNSDTGIIFPQRSCNLVNLTKISRVQRCIQLKVTIQVLFMDRDSYYSYLVERRCFTKIFAQYKNYKPGKLNQQKKLLLTKVSYQSSLSNN